jgi:hypothetical protein
MPVPLNCFVCVFLPCTWCLFIANWPAPCYQTPYTTEPTQHGVTFFFIYFVHIKYCFQYTPLIIICSMLCTMCSTFVRSGMFGTFGGHGSFHTEGCSSPINTLLGLLHPWKWRDYNAAKRGMSLTKQYGVTSHEAWIVRNSVLINRNVARENY